MDQSVPQPAYQLSYEVTLESLVAVAQLPQRKLNRLGIVLGGLLALIGALAFVLGVDLFYSLFAILFGAALLIVVHFGLWERFFIGRMARGVLGSRATAVLDDGGVTFDSDMGTTRLTWAGLTTVQEVPKVIVLMRDRLPIAFIPDSAFAAAGERQEVVAYIRSRLASPAQPPH